MKITNYGLAYGNYSGSEPNKMVRHISDIPKADRFIGNTSMNLSYCSEIIFGVFYGEVRFLKPGNKKPHRRKSYRGKNYYITVRDVLRKASQEGLIDLPPDFFI